MEYTENREPETAAAREKASALTAEEKVKLLDGMEYAFYSLVGLVIDNTLPDLEDEEDEWVQECREIYDNALEEFKESSQKLEAALKSGG